MFSKSFLLMISVICLRSIYGQSATLDSLTVRLSRPSGVSEYLPSDADNYNDGDSMVIDDLDNVWFLIAIGTPQEDDRYTISIEGNNGGSSSTTRKFGKASSGTRYRGHTLNVQSLKDAGSTEMTVTCELSGSSTDALVIRVFISFDGTVATVAPAPVEDAIVADLSVRLSSPGSDFANYVSSNPDNFGHGESITITDLDEFVYFVVVFEDWSAGMQYSFIIEGNNGGFISNSGDISGSGKFVGRSMNGFESSTSMTVKCELLDSNGNLVDSKEIIITLIFDLEPAFVADLSVRLSSPGSDFDNYFSSNPDNFADGEEITIHDLDNFVYFVAIFDNWVTGMQYSFTIEGDNGGSISSSGDISRSGKSVGRNMNGFESSTSMTVKCELLDSNGNAISGSSREITIFLAFGDITPTIDQLSVRLSSPGSILDNYLEDNVDNFVDGESITITDLNDFVYVVATFDENQSSYNVEFEYEGDNGGLISSDPSPMFGGNAWATTMFSFAQSSSMTVTCRIIDAADNVIDSRSIEINLIFDLSSRRRLGTRSRLLDMNH